jgi:hypothetical protein
MLRRLTSRLSYANVIATLALFIALGGSSYAALKLPKNSVGSKQLKANAVSSSKVKAGSLRASDFSQAQRRGLQGPRGERGPAGQTGPTGPAGSFGSVTIRRLLNYNGSGGVAECEAGEFAVGGGARDIQPAGISITESVPVPAGEPEEPGPPVGWLIGLSATPTSADFYVVCVQ